jgi:flagellar hook-associated protein 2
MREMRWWINNVHVEMQDGSRLFLSHIGISTSSNLQEPGQLVVDQERLERALRERPDDIAELFTRSSGITRRDPHRLNAQRMEQSGLAERLNDIIDSAIFSSRSSIAAQAGVEWNANSMNQNNIRQELTRLDER